MVHRSVLGEFKVGHLRPWQHVHLIESGRSNNLYSYYATKELIENLFRHSFFRQNGLFLDAVKLKYDQDVAMLKVKIYWSRVNFWFKKVVRLTRRFYRKVFVRQGQLHSVIGFFWHLKQVLNVLKWFVRGKLLGFKYRQSTWNFLFGCINLLSLWLGEKTDFVKFLRHTLWMNLMARQTNNLLGVINHNIKKMLKVKACRTYLRFILERDLSAPSMARYMGFRLSEGYPIHIVFGFVLRQLKRKSKKQKFVLFFGSEKPNCLGYYFKISGRISRRLRARTTKRRAGKLLFSDHGWIPSYESVQVKTKYGTCGLRVWFLYRFGLQRGNQVNLLG